VVVRFFEQERILKPALGPLFYYTCVAGAIFPDKNVQALTLNTNRRLVIKEKIDWRKTSTYMPRILWNLAQCLHILPIVYFESDAILFHWKLLGQLK
jgi:hypothetical protein